MMFFFFLIWHWISFNTWENYALMLGLITTSFGHFLFATALRGAGTFYFPLGFHLGTNLASQNIISIDKEITSENKGVIFLIQPSGKTFSTMHYITNYIIASFAFLHLLWQYINEVIRNLFFRGCEAHTKSRHLIAARLQSFLPQRQAKKDFRLSSAALGH